MRNVVMTSDKHLWLIPGFLHQWNKYCGAPITVVGFSPPAVDCDFVSLGRFEDYPVEKWSDALLKMLDVLGEEHVMIMLEDYWLIRKTDWSEVMSCYEWMKRFYPGALRFCLTSDRLYSKTVWDVDFISNTDIIEAGHDGYQISFQASIYNSEVLKRVLIPNETPWQVEINGTGRLGEIQPNLRVFGTRQWLIRYQVMVRYGVFTKKGDWMFPARQLSRADFDELKSLGHIPEGE